MSELIQESKYITVDEFLPEWTSLVEKHLGQSWHNEVQQERGLNIACGQKCLVGEAHGFHPWKNGYTDYNGHNFCSYCKDVSLGHVEIDGIGFGEAIDGLKNLYQFKQGLYEHFTEAHPEKLLRK